MNERIERRAFSFSINGEFITQLAKERFFMEGAGYENVMELLLSGHEIKADGQQDERRMDDCRIEEREDAE